MSNPEIKHNVKYYENNTAYCDYLEKHDVSTFQKYVDWVVKCSPINGKFVDVGCGIGQVLEEVNKKNILATGIEISNPSVEICKSKKLDTYFYDGKVFPFPAQVFNVVGSYNVIEHVEDANFFLEEAYRVLKPKGNLIIVCPNFLSVTNNYHWHTAGYWQKFKNLILFFRFLITRDFKLLKMQTVQRDVFHSDDDACNVMNPTQLLLWGKSKKMKLVYSSGQNIYKNNLSNKIDFFPFRLFLGACFVVLQK